MLLTVNRRWYTDKSTIGELLVNNDFFCFTLEDVVREPGVKIPGQTAIPAGHYKVVYDYSPKHQHNLPHILDVPMFTRILIHPGNTNVDTEGCILVGLHREADRITESRKAFDQLLPVLKQGWKDGMIWIEINNTKEQAKI